MKKVDVWKRKLKRLGFEGSIVAWPDAFGADLSLEAVSDSGLLKTVQIIFKVGASDNRPARDLLKDFSKALQAVLDDCRQQVLARSKDWLP